MKELSLINKSLKNYTCNEKGEIFYKNIKIESVSPIKLNSNFYKLEKLLAKLFLENKHNCSIVVFKDNNKSNFNISNLEWSSVNQETYNFLSGISKEQLGKFCTHCKEFVNLDDYYKNNKGSYRNICIKCTKKRRDLKKHIYYESEKQRKKTNPKKSSLNKLRYQKLKDNPEKYKENLKRIKNYKRENWWIDIISRLKNRAKQYNIPFNLKKEDLIIPEICPILEIPISLYNENKMNCVSWDRIIPELGYVKGNVKAISVRANLMKNDASIKEIFTFIKNIESYLGEDVISRFRMLDGTECTKEKLKNTVKQEI